MTAALAPRILLVLLLAGCSHSARFDGDYDESLDRAVRDLRAETNRFFERIPEDSARETEDRKRRFLEGALGSVDAMAARAAVLEEGLAKAPISESVEALRERFEELRAVDLSPPTHREGARESLDDAFRTIQIRIVHLKKAKAQRPGGP